MICKVLKTRQEITAQIFCPSQDPLPRPVRVGGEGTKIEQRQNTDPLPEPHGSGERGHTSPTLAQWEKGIAGIGSAEPINS